MSYPVIPVVASDTCRSCPFLLRVMMMSPGRAVLLGTFLAGLAVPEPKMLSLNRLESPPQACCMHTCVPSAYPAEVYCSAM